MIRDENVDKAAGALETVFCECAHCKGHTLEVYARFEYPDDLFDDPFFAGQEQEFFSWFTLVGKCSKCSTMASFIDFECA